MLTLHIIRHAKTNQISSSGEDFDRQLLEKGIAQANVLGNYIRTHHIALGKIVCSSARRTKQTHSIISQQLPNQKDTVFSDDLYLSTHQTALSLLSEFGKNEKTITLIGHNEGISQLASMLSGEFVHLRTAEMISMTFPFDDWDHLVSDTGIIIFQYRPEVFLPNH